MDVTVEEAKIQQTKTLILIERPYVRNARGAQRAQSLAGRNIISTLKPRHQDGCPEILQIHKREVPLPERGREGTSGI